MRGEFWTKENKRRSFALRAEGLSANKAAILMSAETGLPFTKGMVIGMWARNPPETINSETMESVNGAFQRNEYFVRAKKRTFKEMKASIKFDSTIALRIEALRYGQCKFPFGETTSPEFRFCCEPAWKETSYCEDHYKLCYKQPRKFYGATPASMR